MEVAALSGLLGMAYMVSNASSKPKRAAAAAVAAKPAAATLPSSHTLPPTDRSRALMASNSRLQEPFMSGDPSAVAPHTTSARGFGPELDMMYQLSNGNTYPSEVPSKGPYGTAFGYGTAPSATTVATALAGPAPVPIDSNVPMMEFRSDRTEADPTYIQADYVVSPLSGQRVPSSEYKHNNMQPFYGGRVKQNMSAHSNTSVLDMYNGSGSTQIKKREVENMFEASRAPFGNPLGMEDHTDFFQSRISSRTDPQVRNGEKPFEPVRVAPGLGEKNGFTGKGGFQQLETNEIMRPKDTNELRVATNPKESYVKPVIHGQHFVSSSLESQDMGEIRKYKPDRFYINESNERVFVTNGDQLKDMVRSIQVLPHTTRPETSTEYTGVATSTDYNESYVTGSYRMPQTQQYGGAGYRNADLTGYYTADTDADRADYGKSAIEIRPNERNETSERVMALNAVPAENQLGSLHYTDDARPTRRSEIIGHPRMTATPYGHVDQAPAITVWDSKDIARTTVKETTIYLDRMGIVSGDAAIPNRMKVYDPEDIARPTQKSQVIGRSAWTGPGGNGAWTDAMDTTFAMNMRSNPLKEQIAQGRKPVAGNGSLGLFTGDPGKQASKKLEADVRNDRPLAINRSVDITPGVGDIGRVEYRVPLKLDVSRERNTYSTVEMMENNPLMASQSLRKNAALDAAAASNASVSF